jgi:hypothetical protein
MPQTNSTSKRKQALALALLLDRRARLQLLQFDRIARQRETREERWPELLALLSTLTLEMLYYGAEQFTQFTGISSAALLDSASVLKVEQILRNKLTGMENTVQLMTQLGAEVAGVSIDGARIGYARADMAQFAKSIDYAAAFSFNNGFWQAGRGLELRKVAHATIDSKTTNLCRSRMDGQVRAWDKAFTDPLSGSQWMHPPFVGALLSGDEVYHSCRTVVLPE